MTRSSDPSTDGQHSAPRIDVRQQRVASVYAQALLGAAETQGQAAAVAEDFDGLVDQVLSRTAHLEQVLASAMVSAEQKIQLLDKALAGRVHPLLVDFLKVLARHGRLAVLRSAHQEYRKQLDQLRGRVRVEVVSAAALAEPQTQALSAALRQSLRREPTLETRLEPELLGGVVVRIGDTVFDGSIATQLAHLREQMITRSVHEIQSRRDRFRSASGN